MTLFAMKKLVHQPKGPFFYTELCSFSKGFAGYILKDNSGKCAELPVRSVLTFGKRVTLNFYLYSKKKRLLPFVLFCIKYVAIIWSSIVSTLCWY